MTSKDELHNWASPEGATTMEIIQQSIELAAIPSVTMLLGGLLVQAKEPPKLFAYAMQHFAAGMLIAAIAQELVPPLAHAKKAEDVGGLVIGFIFGVALMIGMQTLLGDHDELEGDCEPKAEDTGDTEAVPLIPRVEDATNGARTGSNISRSREPSPERDLQRTKSNLAFAFTFKDRHDKTDGLSPFPVTFAVAVCVDSLMDGVLIGVSLVTGQRAGFFMAVALCVEMGFLGLTFATSLIHQPRHRAILAIFAGPVILLVGAVIGGAVAQALTTNHAALVGCTAFGVAALMYMVCEELLVSAHESGEEHVWWIDLQVYVGFLFSILMEKLFDLFHE